jgi:hypothetical protein
MKIGRSCDTVHTQLVKISNKGNGIKTIEFDDVKEIMKVCTAVEGRLKVTLQDETFEIGMGGVWRIRQCESCSISGGGAVNVVTLLS